MTVNCCANLSPDLGGMEAAKSEEIVNCDKEDLQGLFLLLSLLVVAKKMWAAAFWAGHNIGLAFMCHMKDIIIKDIECDIFFKKQTIRVWIW